MMKEMTCLEIAEACNGKFFGTEEEGKKIIAGIGIDSRKIEKDWVFGATVGERVDGHSFIPEVFEKQAACVISEKKLENPAGPYILVESTFQALKDIGAYYRSLLDVKIVGITGSVGKTSTKEMIAAVLSEKYEVQKTFKNLNNEVGVPLTLFSIGKEHEVAVVEMGISDFGEMTRLGKMVRPNVMVITNIGQSHLENLKSRDGILKTKTEVFAEMDDSSEVVLNGDDNKLSAISQVHGKKPHFFSKENPEAEVYATDIVSQGLFGSDCILHIGEETIKVHVPLPGEHMVLNAIGAATVATVLGLTPEEIARGISKTRAVQGRGELIQANGYTVIDETYNANPASMRAAIDLLAMANTRKVAVMGDMFELGENTEELHRQTGAYCARKNIDVIVCIGELAKHMEEGAKEERALKESNKIESKKKECDGEVDTKEKGTGEKGTREETVKEAIKEIYYFENKQMFTEQIFRILKPGDAVLLKASHGMKFGKLLEVLKEK